MRNGLDPRRVTRADHDRMYNPFIQELSEFAKRGLCDSINIYSRSDKVDEPRLIYSTNRKNEGSLQIEECIRSIVGERERMHKEIISNPSEYFERIKRAREYINELISDEKIKEEYFSQLTQLEDEISQEISFDR